MRQWTTESDIKAFLAKKWNSGAILSAMVSGRALFPLSVPFHAPASSEMADNIASILKWAGGLASFSKKERGRGYTLCTKRVNHRVLGANDVPSGITIETIDDALFLIKKEKEAAAFKALAEKTEGAMPALLLFLWKHPFKVLEEGGCWGEILSVCGWMLAHPSRGVYLREIDLPGVHTKFIEHRRGLFTELFSMILPGNGRIGNSFEERFGFKTQPAMVRFRFNNTPPFPDVITDMALTSEEFAATPLLCRNVIIIENKTTFLALPVPRDTIIIWGAGYGFEKLGEAAWMSEKRLFYWGDIDTHGLAILSEFRTYFPDTQSFLMDEETLAANLSLCVTEPMPAAAMPEHLTDKEAALFTSLRGGKYGPSMRLEQERIGMGSVIKSLEALLK